MNLPPENGSKEEPGPAEQLSDQNDNQRVQANNNKGESSVEVPDENLGDRVYDQSVQRRNNNGPLPDAPGSETGGGERVVTGENQPQDRSGDRPPQGRGIDRRASFPPDLPQNEHPQVKRSVSVFSQLQPTGRQRKFQLGKGQFCCHAYYNLHYFSVWQKYEKILCTVIKSLESCVHTNFYS